MLIIESELIISASPTFCGLTQMLQQYGEISKHPFVLISFALVLLNP